MAVALDSSVVIGFLDRGDALHHVADSRIRGLLAEGGQLYVSAVTYAEVLTGVKLGRHDEGLVRGFFADLVSSVMPVDLAVAERAAELRGDRKALKMPDALILAGAELDSEVERIVCADAVAEKITSALSCEVERLRARN